MYEIQKRAHFQTKTNLIPLDSMQNKWSRMIQNVKITSILTTFILLMIKDRNIGFWRIFSTPKTEKIPFYLKLVKFLFGKKMSKTS